MAKIRIVPKIEHDTTSGRLKAPVSSFKVIDDMQHNSPEREVALGSDVALNPTLDKMSAHSITPTSFDHRDFESSIDDMSYIDAYRNKTNEVIRFGINSFSSQLDAMFSVDGISKHTQSALSAATSTKSDKYTPKEVEKVIISALECELLNKAIDHLLATPSDVALVDIFARINGGVSNGQIKMHNGSPETHTVLLYKNPHTPSNAAAASISKQEIVVIDPNNFLFSSHLSNFNAYIQNSHQADVTLLVFHKGPKIYIPDLAAGTGPEQHQYRNCIDIAAKIAFGLSKLNADYASSGKAMLSIGAAEDVTQCLVIQNISNNFAVDKDIIDIVAPLPVRIKQRSKIEIVELFNSIKTSISSNHKLLATAELPIAKISAVKTEAATILGNHNATDGETMRTLLQHGQNCADEMHTFLEVERNELLGAIDDLGLL